MYCGDLKVKEVQKGRDTYIYMYVCMVDSYIYEIYDYIYIWIYIWIYGLTETTL